MGSPRSGGNNSSSYAEGFGLGIDGGTIMDKMKNGNYSMPEGRSGMAIAWRGIKSVFAFGITGSNARTQTRSETDYPFRGGFYTGTRQDREFDHGRH